jgi:hypothetical protein
MNIGLINSSCQECCFAVYEGKTQTDCQLGRIETFRRAGNLVECFNENSEFYVVNNRVCTALRPKKWAEQYTDPVKEVRKQLRPTVTGVVIVENYRDYHVPVTNNLLMIRNSDEVPLSTIHCDLKKSGVPFSLIDIKERPFPERETSLYLSANRITGQFFAVLPRGVNLPSDLIDRLDKKLNEKLVSFVAVQFYDFLLLRTSFYKKMMGNCPMELEKEGKKMVVENILDKVRFYSPLLVLSESDLTCS